MGYCPYVCIFCRDVEDNGWNGCCFDAEKAADLTGDDIEDFEGYDKCDYTLDVCDDCLRKIPLAPKSVGSDSDGESEIVDNPGQEEKTEE